MLSKLYQTFEVRDKSEVMYVKALCEAKGAIHV